MFIASEQSFMWGASVDVFKRATLSSVSLQHFDDKRGQIPLWFWDNLSAYRSCNACFPINRAAFFYIIIINKRTVWRKPPPNRTHKLHFFLLLLLRKTHFERIKPKIPPVAARWIQHSCIGFDMTSNFSHSFRGTWGIAWQEWTLQNKGGIQCNRCMHVVQQSDLN